MNTSTREPTERKPNTLKVGDKVYFVTVPGVGWVNQKALPVVHERTVTQSTQKQIKLDGYGPNLSGVFWVDADGQPRHGDCGEEPAFYPTRGEAIAAFQRSVAVTRAKALAVLATCDDHDAWIGGAS
jgi:hypothetical protein